MKTVNQDFRGRFDIEESRLPRGSRMYVEVSFAKYLTDLTYIRREGWRTDEQRSAFVQLANPPAEFVQVAFQAAFGYMPLDVFADWIESYGTENLERVRMEEDVDDDKQWSRLLAGLRHFCETDRRLKSAKESS